MEPSILVGAVVGIVIPVVLAVRSRSSVRWLLGVYRPSFPSGAPPVVRGLGDSGGGGPQDDLGQPRS